MSKCNIMMFPLSLILYLQFIPIHSAISASELSCDPWEETAGNGDKGPAGLGKGSHYNCITNGPVNCPSSTTCSIYCEENISNTRRRRSLLNIDNEACAGVEINCPSNSVCNIYCTFSCKGMIVNAQSSSSLNIYNCGTASNMCNHMTIYCPSHNGNSNGNTCNIFGTTSNEVDNLNIYTQEAFYDIDLSQIDLKDDSNLNIIHCGLNTNEHSCIINSYNNNQCSSITGDCTDFRLTDSPTTLPTQTPTGITNNPSTSPTHYPSYSPSKNPTFNPSLTPSKMPSINPTKTPSNNPTNIPSNYPSQYPTQMPTITTKIPTTNPSKMPTQTPIKNPTEIPTKMPSKYPSKQPTINFTNAPRSVQSKNNSNSMMTLVIVGAMGGAALLICLIICFYYRKRKKYNFESDVQRQKSKNMYALDHTIPVTPEMFAHRAVPSKSFNDGNQLLTEMVLSKKPTIKSVESDDNIILATQPTVGFENIADDEFVVTQQETNTCKHEINNGECDGEGSNTDSKEYDTGTDEGTSNSYQSNDKQTKGFIADLSDDDNDYVIDETIE